MLRRIRHTFLRLRGPRSPGNKRGPRSPGNKRGPRSPGNNCSNCSLLSSLRRKIDVARRKAISRRHVQQVIEQHRNDPVFQSIPPARKRMFMNRVMALPNNRHPLSLPNTRLEFLYVFH